MLGKLAEMVLDASNAISSRRVKKQLSNFDDAIKVLIVLNAIQDTIITENSKDIVIMGDYAIQRYICPYNRAIDKMEIGILDKKTYSSIEANIMGAVSVCKAQNIACGFEMTPVEDISYISNGEVVIFNNSDEVVFEMSISLVNENDDCDFCVFEGGYAVRTDSISSLIKNKFLSLVNKDSVIDIINFYDLTMLMLAQDVKVGSIRRSCVSNTPAIYARTLGELKSVLNDNWDILDSVVRKWRGDISFTYLFNIFEGLYKEIYNGFSDNWIAKDEVFK